MTDSHSLSNMFTRLSQWVPGLTMLFRYHPAWLKNDLAAGVSVAAVALPVGIAYADLAGVPAVFGIYSAIFPLLAYALFGSSRQLMTGPDAATCIMVAASLGPLAGGDPVRYQALVVMLTVMTGIVYVISGVAKLGFIANFLSLPILTGFLNGVALIIIAGQLKKLAGFDGDASSFFAQLTEVVQQLDNFHYPTLSLGIGLAIFMLVLKKLTPRLPIALIVVVIGVALVMLLDLDRQNVAVLGHVPAGMPSLIEVPHLALDEFRTLLRDAAALVLVSFTSGILTAKSFAQRNGYDIKPNQELIGFGMCNIASGVVQGFPVTGADSRTAVNNAMGGKSQLVGIVAATTMLLILFFMTDPLAYVPIAALAAVILISALGLFDVSTLKELYQISRFEFMFSIGTTLGVLILGVLPGVMLAVVLSLLTLLAVNSRPRYSILGRVEGVKGYHSTRDYPEVTTTPGLHIFRFEGNVVFYNAAYFKEVLLQSIEDAEHPVEWLVVDASPVSVVDVSAMKVFEDIRTQLEAKNIVVAVAKERRDVQRFFQAQWVNVRRQMTEKHNFVTLNSAVRAFHARNS